jgi:hypothetical protein
MTAMKISKSVVIPGLCLMLASVAGRRNIWFRESEIWNIPISDQVTALVIHQTIKRGLGNV